MRERKARLNLSGRRCCISAKTDAKALSAHKLWTFVQDRHLLKGGCPSMRFSLARIFMSFFTPESLYGGRGGFGLKIKFRGWFRPTKFLTRMLSLILRRIFCWVRANIFFSWYLIKLSGAGELQLGLAASWSRSQKKYLLLHNSAAEPQINCCINQKIHTFNKCGKPLLAFYQGSHILLGETSRAHKYVVDVNEDIPRQRDEHLQI